MNLYRCRTSAYRGDLGGIKVTGRGKCYSFRLKVKDGVSPSVGEVRGRPVLWTMERTERTRTSDETTCGPKEKAMSDNSQVHPFAGGDVFGDEQSHVVKKATSNRRGSVVGPGIAHDLAIGRDAGGGGGGEGGGGEASPSRTPKLGKRSMRRGSLHPREMQHHIIAAAFSATEMPEDGEEEKAGPGLEIPVRE